MSGENSISPTSSSNPKYLTPEQLEAQELEKLELQRKTAAGPIVAPHSGQALTGMSVQNHGEVRGAAGSSTFAPTLIEPHAASGGTSSATITPKAQAEVLNKLRTQVGNIIQFLDNPASNPVGVKALAVRINSPDVAATVAFLHQAKVHQAKGDAVASQGDPQTQNAQTLEDLELLAIAEIQQAQQAYSDAANAYNQQTAAVNAAQYAANVAEANLTDAQVALIKLENQKPPATPQQLKDAREKVDTEEQNVAVANQKLTDAQTQQAQAQTAMNTASNTLTYAQSNLASIKNQIRLQIQTLGENLVRASDVTKSMIALLERQQQTKQEVKDLNERVQQREAAERLSDALLQSHDQLIVEAKHRMQSVLNDLEVISQIQHKSDGFRQQNA